MTFKYKGTRYNVQDNPYRIETIINENYEKAERGREKNGEIERERERKEGEMETKCTNEACKRSRKS